MNFPRTTKELKKVTLQPSILETLNTNSMDMCSHIESVRQFKDEMYEQVLYKLIRAIRFYVPKAVQELTWMVRRKKYHIYMGKAYSTNRFEVNAIYRDLFQKGAWQYHSIEICPGRNIIWLRIVSAQDGQYYRVFAWHDNRLVRLPDDKDIETFEKALRNSNPRSAFNVDNLFNCLCKVYPSTEVVL